MAACTPPVGGIFRISTDDDLDFIRADCNVVEGSVDVSYVLATHLEPVVQDPLASSNSLDPIAGVTQLQIQRVFAM